MGVNECTIMVMWEEWTCKWREWENKSE